MVGQNYVLTNAPGAFHYSTLKPLVHAMPKRNSNGGSSVVYMAETEYGEKKIFLQTPRCRIPFGINNYKRDDGRDNLSIQIALDRDTHADLIGLLGTLDGAHKKAALDQGGKWFSKPINSAAIDHLYKPSLIEPKDPKYGPTMRLKVNNSTVFFDELEKATDKENVKAGGEVICLVECSTLWFVNQSFQPSYTIVQAQVFNSSANPFTGFAIEAPTDGTGHTTTTAA